MEYTDAMFNRLRRIEGQVRGIMAMMESKRDCKDVISQLSAIRSAVDRMSAFIVAENLEVCVRRDITETGDTHQAVLQAIELLIKSR